MAWAADPGGWRPVVDAAGEPARSRSLGVDPWVVTSDDDRGRDRAGRQAMQITPAATADGHAVVGSPGFGGPVVGDPLVGAAPAPTAEVTTITARANLISEQLELARAEIALSRAAYRRAVEEETASRPWLVRPMDMVELPRVNRALRMELAALDRFRVWALELYWLRRMAI